MFNAGSEWNESSLVYETNFRDYDPAIGRFYANDPLSLQGHSLTPYRFGFNNPVSFNDPTGLFEHLPEYWDRKEREWKISEALRLGIEFISSDVVRGGSFGGFIKTTETTITTFRGTVAERGGPRYGHGSSSSNAPRYVTFSVAHTTTTMSPNQGLIKFGTSGQNMEPPKGGGPPIGGDAGAQQGPRITGAVINTGMLSSDNNCVNCGLFPNGQLGVNARPGDGYFNGVEVRFTVSGDLSGYTVLVKRTKAGYSYSNIHGGSTDYNRDDGPDSRNTFVSGNNIYSVDSPGVWGLAVNPPSGLLYFELKGNFVETATIFDADGNQVGEPYSIQWSSTMRIGRSSPDGIFQNLGGSIGPGHVKIP